MTTSRPYLNNLPSQSTKSPSSILASSSKTLNQMTCPHTVGDPPVPFDTPGPSPDETTPQRKSYAAVTSSEAARPKSGPLGLDPAAWPPLASMVDPPPRQFTMAKDPVPPDRPPPIKKRRRRPRTRRHRKQSRNKQPATNSPIKSNTDLTAVLSSIINDIQKQSLITLCGVYKESIATVQNEIFLDLQNVLRHAISRLGTKLRAEFSNSKPKQKVFFKEYSRPPKHRQTRKKDILPDDTDQTETNFDENKNSDENAFSENEDNDLDANELGFGIYEGDGAAHRVSTRHPEMVHGHNFDCRVQTDDENGHIFTTEIDEENEEFSEKDSDDGNMNFSEGHSDNDAEPSSGDNWSDGASSQADY